MSTGMVMLFNTTG